jgi:ABC-type Fe3+-siderophore transport system permease subunit
MGGSRSRVRCAAIFVARTQPSCRPGSERMGSHTDPYPVHDWLHSFGLCLCRCLCAVCFGFDDPLPLAGEIDHANFCRHAKRSQDRHCPSDSGVGGRRGWIENHGGDVDCFFSNERQLLFKLRLPYAVPYIFAGLRIATTLAVLGAIVAEWLAASSGLGYLVLSGSFNFNTARSFAAIIALAIIGTAFFALMSWFEQRISWRSVQIQNH